MPSSIISALNTRVTFKRSRAAEPSLIANGRGMPPPRRGQLAVMMVTKKVDKEAFTNYGEKDADDFVTPIVIPGFERASTAKQGVSVKDRNKTAPAQQAIGYAPAGQKSQFGGKVYKLGKNRKNVDEYSPIFTPEYFGDDFITGCDNKTYVTVLGIVAAASAALPATIVGLAGLTASESTGLFPYNLL